ncbi:response regulator [Sphingomicrobium arenosum]|uniref:response regulator n=1 Tax=Sphingomicrobium arenosum TaxID=2233861 RepID=UPI002240DB89|nr:response regulator [Sphingomicrobium arenosum]
MARRPRLLLIDDEPALAAFLADAARLSAFEPVIATDHRDFRDIFRTHPPDMVAIDLGMPGMDGVELLRFLADNRAQQPILIVSGFEDRIIETAFRLGRELGLNMVGPIGKPARLATLEDLFVKVRERLVA